MSVIERIEVLTFRYELMNLGVDTTDSPMYAPGRTLKGTGWGVVITDTDGAVGEFVTPVHDAALVAQCRALAPHLIGRDPNTREQIYDDCKLIMRKLFAFGHSSLDIALWDMMGKRLGVSVATLLGGFRKALPAYASTFHGDREGGLSSKEAYADFAEECHGLGFKAYKIHGWTDGDRIAEAAMVRHVGAKVGQRMDLMLDCACKLRTFADALYVGRACDDAGFFWYEDPFRDGGYSRHVHRKLRQSLKTPLLITEHVRGFEAKADFITSEATDFVRANAMLDMGITGVMKIAHLAEAHGLDVELHGPGPANRHCMAAIRNTNYYELSLVAPKIGNPQPPIYTCGYSDALESVDRDGCYPVPAGPGLGVSHDWDFIKKNEIDRVVFT